jgi:hypothetical protein
VNGRGASWPGLTLARGIWLANRCGFLGVIAAVLVLALGYRLAGAAAWERGTQDASSYLPMGFSIFLIFVFCNFTESDRRARFTGFPSRLFAYPVPTRTLVAAPILFGVAAVTAVYVAWAKLVFTALGRELPLGWPILYLATGMICFQAVIWSLARFRLTRLLALGFGGAALAVGWLGFSKEEGANLPAHSKLCLALATTAVAAFGLAWFAVESQRRGARGEWQGWRKLVEWLTDALPRHHRRFASRNAAQFWFEWKRHGKLVPLMTAGVLLLIMAPAPFFAPLRAGTTMFALVWILVLPLLLAFALGKGFGKADLWSKEPGLPLFLAAKPLSNTEWIGAKMKAAALAAITSWLITLVLTAIWLWLWCDCSFLAGWRRTAETFYPGSVLYALPALCFGIMVVLTWRLFVGSLYIGFSGKAWLLGTAACGVVLVFLASPAIGAGLTTYPGAVFRFLQSPWLPWALAGLFAGKVVAVLALAHLAHRRGWVTGRALARYVAVWLMASGFLLLAVWLLTPVHGWMRWLLSLLALLVVPLLRPVFAPMALARNRWR